MTGINIWKHNIRHHSRCVILEENSVSFKVNPLVPNYISISLWAIVQVWKLVEILLFVFA